MDRLRSLYEHFQRRARKLKIKIISVGKTKEKSWRAAEAEYSKRIMRYAQLEHIQVKNAPAGSIKNAVKVMELEANSILAKINQDEFAVALDRQGKQISSQGFAEFLSFKMLHGASRITIILRLVFCVSNLFIYDISHLSKLKKPDKFVPAKPLCIIHAAKSSGKVKKSNQPD